MLRDQTAQGGQICQGLVMQPANAVMGGIEPARTRCADQNGNAEKNTIDFDNCGAKHDVEP